MYKIDTVLEPFVSNEVTIQHYDESAPLDMDEYSVQWDATPVDGRCTPASTPSSLSQTALATTRRFVTASPANAEFGCRRW